VRPRLALLFARLPVPVLGALIALSALQASCSGEDDDRLVAPDERGMSDAPAAHDRADAEVATPDAPSMDSAEDRADGMSYGDGYSP
jgi:hypothetical protein